MFIFFYRRSSTWWRSSFVSSMQKIAILYKKEQGLLFTADVSTVYRVIVSTQLQCRSNSLCELLIKALIFLSKKLRSTECMYWWNLILIFLTDIMELKCSFIWLAIKLMLHSTQINEVRLQLTRKKRQQQITL